MGRARAAVDWRKGIALYFDDSLETATRRAAGRAQNSRPAIQD